jgi:hypothetical protein
MITKQQLHRFWESNLANYILLIGLITAGAVWTYGNIQTARHPSYCYEQWYNNYSLVCYKQPIKLSDKNKGVWVLCQPPANNEYYPQCSNTIEPPPSYTPLPSISNFPTGIEGNDLAPNDFLLGH